MEDLNFKYSGLFQDVKIRIYQSAKSGTKHTIAADADIKLPILKKSYTVATEFDEGKWIAQCAPHEKGAQPWRVERRADMHDVHDPISFFLDLHTGDWSEATVKLAIGGKVVELDVISLKDGYEIKRRDKDQKLIVRKNAKGILALEIPLPVIGTISIKRV